MLRGSRLILRLSASIKQGYSTHRVTFRSCNLISIRDDADCSRCQLTDLLYRYRVPKLHLEGAVRIICGMLISSSLISDGEFFRNHCVVIKMAGKCRQSASAQQKWRAYCIWSRSASLADLSMFSFVGNIYRCFPSFTGDYSFRADRGFWSHLLLKSFLLQLDPKCISQLPEHLP